MTNVPKVSVVIKAYNHAAYVRQTIQSVLDQSFQDFEIVVTDDASTDATADIVREFKDPRIDLQVLPRNHGISIAMNTTIARARGEYLAILNSDDYALPGRLEKQVALLEANPDVSVSFGMPLPIDDNGMETKAFNSFIVPADPEGATRAAWLRYLFYQGNCFCGPSGMIRRTAYAAAGPYDPRFTNLQDYDMWIRMLKAGRNIHVMPDRLTAFRIRANNANMSAPRWDSRLRTQFETAQILKQYSTMEPGLLAEVFSVDLVQRGIPPGSPPEAWLADVALGTGRASHCWFALQLLFDTARDLEDYNRLRDLTGRVDIFGLNSVYVRDNEIARLQRELANQKPQNPSR
jgi:glycosyltransferase involved in cell wall biosynthesis